MPIKASRAIALSSVLIEQAPADVVCLEVGKLLDEGYTMIQITGIRFDVAEEQHPEWEACKR